MTLRSTGRGPSRSSLTRVGVKLSRQLVKLTFENIVQLEIKTHAMGTSFQLSSGLGDSLQQTQGSGIGRQHGSLLSSIIDLLSCSIVKLQTSSYKEKQ